MLLCWSFLFTSIVTTNDHRSILQVRMHKQMAEVQGIAYSPYGEYSPPAPIHPAAAYSNSYEPSVAYAASSYTTSAASYAAAAPVSYPSVQGQGYSIAQQVI